MGSTRAALLCLVLGGLALGIGLLSSPDSSLPVAVVRNFLEALSQGDSSVAANLVEGGENSRGSVHPTGSAAGSSLSGLDLFRIQIKALSNNGHESVVLVGIVCDGSAREWKFGLIFYRGLGWKIRTIDGLRVNPRTLADAFWQAVHGNEMQFVDQESLKRDLEKIWKLPPDAARPVIASPPENRLRRF